MEYIIEANAGKIFNCSQIKEERFDLKAKSANKFSLYYIDKTNANNIMQKGDFINVLDSRYLKEDVSEIKDTLRTYKGEGYLFIHNKNTMQIKVEININEHAKTLEGYFGFSGFGSTTNSMDRS